MIYLPPSPLPAQRELEGDHPLVRPLKLMKVLLSRRERVLCDMYRRGLWQLGYDLDADTTLAKSRHMWRHVHRPLWDDVDDAGFSNLESGWMLNVRFASAWEVLWSVVIPLVVLSWYWIENTVVGASDSIWLALLISGIVTFIYLCIAPMISALTMWPFALFVQILLRPVAWLRAHDAESEWDDTPPQARADPKADAASDPEVEQLTIRINEKTEEVIWKFRKFRRRKVFAIIGVFVAGFLSAILEAKGLRPAFLGDIPLYFVTLGVVVLLVVTFLNFRCPACRKFVTSHSTHCPSCGITLNLETARNEQLTRIVADKRARLRHKPIDDATTAVTQNLVDPSQTSNDKPSPAYQANVTSTDAPNNAYWRRDPEQVIRAWNQRRWWAVVPLIVFVSIFAGTMYGLDPVNVGNGVYYFALVVMAGSVFLVWRLHHCPACRRLIGEPTVEQCPHCKVPLSVAELKRRKLRGSVAPDQKLRD